MEDFMKCFAQWGKEQLPEQDFCLGAKLKSSPDFFSDNLITDTLNSDGTCVDNSVDLFPDGDTFGPEDLFTEECLKENLASDDWHKEVTNVVDGASCSPEVYLIKHEISTVKCGSLYPDESSYSHFLSGNTEHKKQRKSGGLHSEPYLLFGELEYEYPAADFADEYGHDVKIESFLAQSSYYTSDGEHTHSDREQYAPEESMPSDSEQSMTVIKAIDSNFTDKLDVFLLPENDERFAEDMEQDVLSVSSWSSAPGTPCMSPENTEFDSMLCTVSSPEQVVPSSSITIFASGDDVLSDGNTSHAKFGRRVKKYTGSLSSEGKRERKKQQNKEAALRYREKCKKEKVGIGAELRDEEDRRQELQIKYAALKQELSTMKKIIRELLIAKKVASPDMFQ